LDVFGSDIGRGEETQERSALRGGFNRWAATGFFALHDTNYCDNSHAGFASGLDCVDRGSSRGANVVHNDHAGALTAKALDATASAVSLLGLANQEAMQQRRAGV
jgi:hypothetical protein